MPVRFFYVDESYDTNRYCLSAISIRHSQWKECFDTVRQHRVNLKNDYGVYLRKEIHARELVAGRGKISPKPITKWQRSRIFLGMLNLVAALPELLIYNICLNVADYPDPQLIAWDRLMNRIQRSMQGYESQELPLRRKIATSAESKLSAIEFSAFNKRFTSYNSRAVIFADEGRENEITKAIRKMHVMNHIPSKYGKWSDGNLTKNITTDHIIEDPIFKRSDRSYFIQLADCVAFALLKREVSPTPNIKKYGIENMFEEALSGVCNKKCSPKDPLGIVRK